MGQALPSTYFLNVPDSFSEDQPVDSSTSSLISDLSLLLNSTTSTLNADDSSIEMPTSSSEASDALEDNENDNNNTSGNINC